MLCRYRIQKLQIHIHTVTSVDPPPRRVVCQSTPSPTLWTVSLVCWRRCSSHIQLSWTWRSRRVAARQREGLRPSSAWTPSTGRCPGCWRGAAVTSRPMVSHSLSTFTHRVDWMHMKYINTWCCWDYAVHRHVSPGLQTVGIFRVGSSKKRVRQVSTRHPQRNTAVTHTFTASGESVWLVLCFLSVPTEHCY